MSIILFANNANSTLAGAITSTAVTANLAVGTGVIFPAPSAGQFFCLTFVDTATGFLNEIVHVTNVTGDTITMVRGQEGTDALNWQAGDIAAELVTAGTLESFVQTPTSQGQATNYAVDSGTANSYVAAFSPVISTLVVGMPLRVKIAHTNTGASTLDPGTGPGAIINPDGTALAPNTLVVGGSSGGIYEFIPDGNGNFQLSSASDALLNASGLPQTGDWKWRADTLTQTGFVRANGLTIGNAASAATERNNADCAALFSYLWTNFNNTQCPVSGGRGGSAAADFAANKTITLLDARGMSQIGLDTMGNSAAGRFAGVPFTSGNATTAGSVAGENVHVLAVGELPAHTHTFSATTSGESATHVHPAVGGGQYFLLEAGSFQINGGSNTNTSTNTAANTADHTHTVSGTTGTGTGGGGGHNTVHLVMLGTFYIKL